MYEQFRSLTKYIYNSLLAKQSAVSVKNRKLGYGYLCMALISMGFFKYCAIIQWGGSNFSYFCWTSMYFGHIKMLNFAYKWGRGLKLPKLCLKLHKLQKLLKLKLPIKFE